MLQPPIDTNILWTLAPGQFLETSKIIFNWQVTHNPVYKKWVELNKSSAIPFLPISFFKTQDIFIGEKPIHLFESSGTTQDVKSCHWVQDISLYEASFLEGFKLFYGDPSKYCIIGLLPSYLERKHSSLVYMVDKLIKSSGHAQSGFYLYDHEALSQTLKANEAAGQQTLLIGVTFALLDFAAKFQMPLEHTTILETGGMKGRRKELTREEVHAELMDAFKVKSIHGEYGMTELLSQAYATGNGMYKCPPWMRVLVTEEEDPLTVKTSGRGTLQVIDLANVHSCAFIATEDVGAVYADGSFEVFGRMDHSALRGCSLMVL